MLARMQALKHVVKVVRAAVVAATAMVAAMSVDLARTKATGWKRIQPLLPTLHLQPKATLSARQVKQAPQAKAGKPVRASAARATAMAVTVATVKSVVNKRLWPMPQQSRP